MIYKFIHQKTDESNGCKSNYCIDYDWKDFRIHCFILKKILLLLYKKVFKKLRDAIHKKMTGKHCNKIKNYKSPPEHSFMTGITCKPVITQIKNTTNKNCQKQRYQKG